MRIGVLALQGAFIEHEHILQKCGVEVVQVRKQGDLEGLDGIIFPGGESTAMIKLLEKNDLNHALKTKIFDGLPVWGTCAGLILLSDIVDSDPGHFRVMNISTSRNAYGRQLGSFSVTGPIQGLEEPYPMVFIRAPIIKGVRDHVAILAEVDGQIVAAREEKMLATAFHPELTSDYRMHEYFIKMCQGLI